MFESVVRRQDALLDSADHNTGSIYIYLQAVDNILICYKSLNSTKRTCALFKYLSVERLAMLIDQKFTKTCLRFPGKQTILP